MKYPVAAVLAIAIMGCTAPDAQQPANIQDAAKAAGALPLGWKARLDDPAAKPDAVQVVEEKEALTVTSGPGGIYYTSGMKAEKDYTLSAVFSQLKPSTTPESCGLFVAGADLDKDTPRYTAFLIRQDGKYQISTRMGEKITVVVDWTPTVQMKEPKGVKTSNTLTIRALQDGVHFLIGEKEVHQMPRARAGGDGIAGVRIGPNLSVQVSKLDVEKFP